jgi:hypothetical protein
MCELVDPRRPPGSVACLEVDRFLAERGGNTVLEILEAARASVPRLFAKWAIPPPGDLGLLATRLGFAICYHWSRFEKQEGKRLPIDDVVGRLRDGQLSHRSDYREGEFANPLEELALIEAVCQRDPSALELFQKTYDGVINDVIAGIRDPRAPQVLDGFGVDLWLQQTKDGRCKLDSFSGQSPFRLWLPRVAHREFLTRLRKADRPDRSPPSDDRPEETLIDFDMVGDYLLPVAELYHDVVSRLDAVARQIWVEVELNWKPQLGMARKKNVSTTYVSRDVLKAVWLTVNKKIDGAPRLRAFEAEHAARFPSVFSREDRPKFVEIRLGYPATEVLRQKLIPRAAVAPRPSAVT